MAIPDEVIGDVRDRTDIVAVVGEHVQLKKVGVNWKGLCPFHQEKTPSFHVNPARHTFYCFGCQKKGDVFHFLMELQGKSFIEVLREMAGRTGVALPEREITPEERQRRSERGQLFELNAAVASFYQRHLESGWRYLRARGIGEEIAHGFRLGAAPDQWDALVQHLEREKLGLGHAQLLGLVAPRQKGAGHYDKFRNRLMCPVILAAGEVAGFSGRTLGSDPETPKYVNSPESPIYKKSQLLYGLHAARPAFHRAHRAILVEGNFDVVAMHQAGFAETIAPLGTALTEQQIDVLRRLTDSVVLLLDGDKAGRAAGLRAIPMFLAANVPAKIALLPDGEDPDSFVRKQGREAMEKILAGATPVIEFFLNEIWRRSDKDMGGRDMALREAAPILAAVTEPVRRDLLIDQLAHGLGVETRVIKMVMQSGSPAAGRATPAPREAPPLPAPGTPPPSNELKLFGLLFDHPDLLETADQLGIQSLLTDERLRDMYSAARKGRSFLDVAPDSIRDHVARELLGGNWAKLADPQRSLVQMVRNLEIDQLLGEADRLSRAVRDAQRRGDAALVRELNLKHLETRKRADQLKRRPEEEPR